MMRKALKLILSLLIILPGTFLHAQNPCGTPDVLSFGSVPSSGTTVYVYWGAISGATSYNIEYRVRNVGASYSAPSSSATNSFTINNLTPSTDYEFIVQSICGTDSSAYSASGWFTTPANNSSATLTRGPYLTGASKSGITIQWKTDISCNSEVHYGLSPTSLTDVITTSTPGTSHSITLSNLLPDTKYYYSVGTPGFSIQATASNYFYTAPLDNDTVPIRFWVTGDFGTGTSAQTAVRNSFANFTAGQKINGWLWLGDNAYSNGLDQEYQTNVFNVYPAQLKNIPLFPALGNHDYGQSGYCSSASLGTNFPYFNIFDIPSNSGTEKYYSVNYGNVHLIALDSYGSYNSVNSAMYNWLEADLNNNTKQWTIVYFHHPPYSKGSHDSDNSTEMVDMRNHIIPLLESNGVDLVLSGHSHSYERSYFIKGHYGNESSFNSSYMVQPGGGPYSKSTRTGDGTVYLVCGVSGQTSATASGWPHNAMYYSSASLLGSLILDITQNSLTCKFLTSNESIADQFTITKQSSVLNTGIANVSYAGSASVNIYPNPAKDEFNISLQGFGDKSVTLQMYNAFGQLVYNKKAESVQTERVIAIHKNDLNGFSGGLYYITVSGERNTITRPVILE